MTQLLPGRNAVAALAEALPRAALARLARRSGRGLRSCDETDRALRRRLEARFGLDLVGLLNRAQRDELEIMARACGVEASGAIGPLRARLWRAGALAEAACELYLGSELQPVPVVLRGKLVRMAPVQGLTPPASRWPRPIPPAQPIPVYEIEPDSLEQLLERAQRLLGARFGECAPNSGRNKGALGASIAAALGVVEGNHSEPDWRGQVEIKTVPVVRDPSSFWRVKEDPAISMATARPLAKLSEVLWIARVADCPESPVLSWHYQVCTPSLRRLQLRDLHTRPKGGAGATTRGWYLRKRYFADCGFLRALNG